MALRRRGGGADLRRVRAPDAYRLDILGSSLGIAAFSGLAFLDAPPACGASSSRRSSCSLLRGSARWSMRRPPGHRAAAGRGLGCCRSALVALLQGDASARSATGRVAITRQRSAAPVHLPPRASCAAAALLPVPVSSSQRPPGDVLIVGAGNGNDVAVALSQGREAHRRRRDRPGDPVDRRRTTPTTPTRTPGSACTSTTAGRSWSAPTTATT